MFLGMPLQTPMPFAGEAVALPITMLTQKRGGKSKAAPVPDAAIITTAGGQAGRRAGEWCACVCGGLNDWVEARLIPAVGVHTLQF
jgi:hypothetical protein